MLTKALRALEAAGRAFDRPFEVEFKVKETRAVSFLRAQEKPENPLVSRLDDVKTMLSGPDITGITVVVPEAGADEHLLPLAQAIRDEADRLNGDSGGAWLIDYDATARPGGVDHRGGFDLFDGVAPTLSDVGRSGELVFCFEWAESSPNGQGRDAWTDAAGSALVAILSRLELVDPNAPERTPEIHFIGHGAGSMVVSQAVGRLGWLDIGVDHVTYLDPHDFSQDGLADDAEFTTSYQPEDGNLWTAYGASVWDNVAFTDVYYQTAGRGGTAEGRPIPGAYNLLINSYLPSTPVTGHEDHDSVWEDFYRFTVYSPTNGGSSTTGYGYSRIVGGEAERPAPTFFANLAAQVPPDQCHEHSPPELVSTMAGTPNIEVLATLGLSEKDVTYSTRQASWDYLEVVNGNFDAIPNYDGVAQPGWNHFAGGGGGEILRGDGEPGAGPGGDGPYKQLRLFGQDGSLRSTNYLLIPHEATHLVFSLYVVNHDDDDVLQVKLNDRLLGAPISLSEGASDPRCSEGVCRLALPPGIGGAVTTLEFSVFDELGTNTTDRTIDGRPVASLSDVTADLRIDDIAFLSENTAHRALGRTGDVIPIQLNSEGLTKDSGDGLRMFLITEGGQTLLTQQKVGDGHYRYNDPNPLPGQSHVIGDIVGFEWITPNQAPCLYFIPAAWGPFDYQKGSYLGFEGTVRGSFTLADHSELVFDVSVFPGYTITDAHSPLSRCPVGNEDNVIGRISLQNRLRYFGFVGKDGNPLEVDGSLGTNTQWAIALFNSVVRGPTAKGQMDKPASALTATGKKFINASNAPRWIAMPEGGTGWTNIELLEEKKGAHWGTSWMLEVINKAGQLNLSGKDLEVDDVSGRTGKTSGHTSHQIGLDLDIDLPGDDIEGDVPFYLTHLTPGGVRYVAAKNEAAAEGKYVVVWDPNQRLYRPEPLTGDLSNAVLHKKGPNTDEKCYAWENKDVLTKIRRLIVDIPQLKYVAKQVKSFRDQVHASTRSGATVEYVFYNDPRLYNDEPDATNAVRYWDGHGAHLHIRIKTPPVAQGMCRFRAQLEHF